MKTWTTKNYSIRHTGNLGPLSRSDKGRFFGLRKKTRAPEVNNPLPSSSNFNKPIGNGCLKSKAPPPMKWKLLDCRA